MTREVFPSTVDRAHWRYLHLCVCPDNSFSPTYLSKKVRRSLWMSSLVDRAFLPTSRGGNAVVLPTRLASDTATFNQSLRTGLSAGPGPPGACFGEAASAQPADSCQRDPASASARTLSPTHKSDQISAVGPATALPGDNGPSQCALNRMTQQFSWSNAV